MSSPADTDMAERRGSLSGPLRISAPVTFGRLHLGPALYPFLARHPKLEMTLELDDRRVDAASAGFDAVIRHGPILDSRLVVWRIATSRRVLVAAPDYLARGPAVLGSLDEGSVRRVPLPTGNAPEEPPGLKIAKTFQPPRGTHGVCFSRPTRRVGGP